MKTFFSWVLGILLAIVVLIVVSGITFGWRYVSAPIRGKVQVQEQLHQGENIIQQYNRFHELCGTLRSYQDQISFLQDQGNQQGGLTDRQSAELRGLRGQLSRGVNQYNAEASEDYTRARFLDSDLPYRLNTNQVIQCN